MRRTYRYGNGKEIRGVEVIRGERPVVNAPMVMVDSYALNPTESPIDGTVISSRAELNAHNERHGVVCVGGDPAWHPDRIAAKQQKRPPPIVTGQDFKDILDRFEAHPELIEQERNRKPCPVDPDEVVFVESEGT